MATTVPTDLKTHLAWRFDAVMFRTWRSTCATKVLCNPASKASASWDSSLVLRSETTFAASRARALTLFLA